MNPDRNILNPKRPLHIGDFPLFSHIIVANLLYRVASKYGQSCINAWSRLVARSIQYHNYHNKYEHRVSNKRLVQSLFLPIPVVL